MVEKHYQFYWRELEKKQEVLISSFIPTYLQMQPSLHPLANNPQKVDGGALSYALGRLPNCIGQVDRVLLGQSRGDFAKAGFKISEAQEALTKARKRRCYFLPNKATLACYIASATDVDDLVNALIAYLIEKRKQGEQKEISVQLLADHEVGYRQIAQSWWTQVRNNFLALGLEDKPLYFISSNLHGLVNIIGGFARSKQVEIFDYIQKSQPEMYREWLKIEKGENKLRVNHFLYYLSKLYFETHPKAFAEKLRFEEKIGIKQVRSVEGLDCNAQLIPVSLLGTTQSLDPHLKVSYPSELAKSEALIINIQYPLGMSAYYLLSELLENLKLLKGVYIIGKAAILAGQVGDIQIPSTVFDKNSRQTFLFPNIFNQKFPFASFQASILKEQKAVSVKGTFLENQKQLEGYKEANFNIVEMESGPYLKALSEYQSEVNLGPEGYFHLDNLPLELGIINYASDNPFAEESLAKGTLGLRGIESTYLAGLAVLERIIQKEEMA
ncbi:hypothetical protein ISS42_00245 [Candidatus Shapirobacteria bacterium]|nr:hypothetical protein [Candidatus Shapirobacteria bacterium]